MAMRDSGIKAIDGPIGEQTMKGEAATAPILVASTTRADKLRKTLEEMIVDGRLQPGARLDEMELARRFGLSRTPVREAIRSLIATGLVEMRGRQGASVTVPSIPALIEMFDLMSALEGLCAGLAARRATDEQKQRLRLAHAKLEEAYEARDPERFYDINGQFHDILYESAHTHFLADQAIQLGRRLEPFRHHVTYQPGRMKATLNEHVRIMDAIDAGDSEAAEAAAKEHVRLLGDQLTDFIASLPPSMMLKA